MKPLYFKTIALCLFVLLFSRQEGEAQPQRDTTGGACQDTIWKREPQYRYDTRLQRYIKVHSALIPTHQMVQLYGGMGLVSFGVGWDYGRRDQWATDVLIGFVPKYEADRVRVTLTLKETYSLWRLRVNEHFSAVPLTCGLYLNTIFSNDYWGRQPEYYPKGYYTFSTRARLHVFLGQRLDYEIPPERRFFVRAIGAFYEISTCDMYLISAFGNRSLQPRDFLRFSFGLKFRIF